MSYSACDFMDEVTDALVRANLVAADAFADEDEGSMDTTGDVCCAAIQQAGKESAAARAMLAALKKLVGKHDQPHGFADDHWYHRELEPARAAIAQAEAAGIK